MGSIVVAGHCHPGNIFSTWFYGRRYSLVQYSFLFDFGSQLADVVALLLQVVEVKDSNVFNCAIGTNRLQLAGFSLFSKPTGNLLFNLLRGFYML